MTVETTPKEILTYEAYQRDNTIMLHLPMSKLSPEQFVLEDNTLYIKLQNGEVYYIRNLNERLTKHILSKTCFLVENLDQINGKTYLIDLDTFNN